MLFTSMCFLLAGHGLLAENNSAFQKYSHTGWTSRDGAPSNIEGLAQTPDGYLWIASQHGLYHFDGVRFERFSASAGASLPSDHIRSILALPTGALWVSYLESGVSRIEGNSVTTYNLDTTVAKTTFYHLCAGLDGELWAATNLGLQRFDGDRWSVVAAEPGLTVGVPSALFADKEGRLWVLCNYGIAYVPRGGKMLQSAGLKYDNFFAVMNETADGTLWVSGIKGKMIPFRFRDDRLKRIGADLNLKSLNIMVDRAGALWVLTTDAGLRCSTVNEKRALSTAQPRFSRYGKQDGLTSDEGTWITQDREGDIWTATTKGLDRFTPAKLQTEPMPSGTRALSIVKAGDDGILATTGAVKPGILHYTVNHWGALPAAPQFLTAAYRDGKGDVWFGARGRIWRYSAKRFVPIQLPESMRGENVSTFCNDATGRLWVIFDKGLFAWDNGTWISNGGLAGLPNDVPRSLNLDRFGRLWISYDGDHLFLLKEGEVSAVPAATGLHLGYVSAIAQSSSRTWVGGLLGIQFFDGERFLPLFTHDEPLSEVSGIALTANGDLWANETSAVLHVQAAELDRFYADHSYKVRVDKLDSLDGTEGGPYPDRRLPSLVETRDGRLWFTSATGVTSLDPEQIRRNSIVPTVLIGNVEADGNVLQGSGPLQLPARSENVSIRYTALSLAIPERVRFRYKLEGFDRNWQEVNTRREAFYPHLPPGKYVFRVTACNDDGLWNDNGAILALSVAPAYWQSLPFQVICLTLVVALAFTFHMLRLRRLGSLIKEKLYERTAERERIARDLHDSFFQDIQGLLLRFNTATNMLHRAEPARRILEDALSQSDVTMQEGRERLLDGRLRALDSSDLPAAFQTVCAELEQPFGVKYVIAVNGNPRPLHPIVSEEIYYVGREALCNAFQHARAAKIEVELSYEAKQVRFCFRDDGVGIEPNILAKGRRPGHWGLPGMRGRADHIGARLTIWSRERVGTEIELRVPAGVAYASSGVSIET